MEDSSTRSEAKRVPYGVPFTPETESPLTPPCTSMTKRLLETFGAAVQATICSSLISDGTSQSKSCTVAQEPPELSPLDVAMDKLRATGRDESAAWEWV